MTQRPSFETNGLDLDTDEGNRELERRWNNYDQEMKALITAGGVHQDDDGWWIDDKTGELIGPDPSIERPLMEGDVVNARPFSEACPELYASIQRNKIGRPKSGDPKKVVTIRLDRDLLERLKAEGSGWQTRVNTILRKAMGLK